MAHMPCVSRRLLVISRTVCSKEHIDGICRSLFHCKIVGFSDPVHELRISFATILGNEMVYPAVEICDF